MRWLVTGAAGQVGYHVVDRLRSDGQQVVALTRADLDLTSRRGVDATIAAHQPDVVINAAAYTAVDAAEGDEDAAYLVNAVGPGLLATAIARERGRLIHMSTDYVFDGTSTVPYEPGDAANPQTAYGRTKLAGEQAVRSALPDRSYVIRTAWLYGGPGANFVDTMLRLEKDRESVDVVDDQVGSPTYARDLAAALVELGRADVEAGVMHYVNAGQTSWCGLAREVFTLVAADPDRVRPVSSAAFARAAPRPGWSVLSTRSWTSRGLPAPRNWQPALVGCLETDRGYVTG